LIVTNSSKEENGFWRSIHSLVLRVVTAANVGEREGGRRVLKPVKQMGSSVSRLHTIWVDAGFEGEPFMQSVMNSAVGPEQVVLRFPNPRLPGAQETLVVERTFGWLIGYRRLLRDYELLPQTSETLFTCYHPYGGRLAYNLTLDNFSNILLEASPACDSCC